MKLYIGPPPRQPHRWRRRFFKLAVVLIIIFVGAFFALDRYEPDGVPILEFHKVSDADDDYLTISQADFSALLDYLKGEGYVAIGIRDFLRARKGDIYLPKKPVIITFDDGYSDMYDNAAPIMEAHGMRGVVYMVTNYVGFKNYLTWPQLRELQKRGFEVGSHTANHRPLTDLSREDAIDETKLSYLIMNWNKLKFLLSLSYPEGCYDDRLPQILKSAGYYAAVTGEPGYNTLKTNPYFLNRINVVRPQKYGPGAVYELRLRLARAKLYHLIGWDKHEE